MKTPLPFLALLGCGIVFTKSRRQVSLALAFSLSILGFCAFSHINLGMRHILPVYIGFAIVAGAGAAQLIERARESRVAWSAVALLGIWMFATSMRIHPDYIAYFNPIAGDHPENILTDSDLDWARNHLTHHALVPDN